METTDQIYERYGHQLEDLLEASRILLSDISPSVWTEQNRVMTTNVSPFPGPFSYERTPYLREVVDCLSPDHPARIVAVMKGAQIGFSTGVIEAGIGWIISQNPGNILLLTGHSDLVEEAMNTKIDQMIDSCGLRPLIRPSVLRKKNMRTGDTNKGKEFPGGSLVAGSASNHKLLRQRSVRFGFIDDFDAAKTSSKESGSTTKMIEQRFAAYHGKMKLYYISTPELRQTSNIEPVYHLGDQRRYHIPCPCCGEFIPLHWSIELDGDKKEKAGITWKADEAGKLIKDSVGYICQKCGGFFTDENKYELNLAGHWEPTAEPSQEGYYSYHISSLYAPPGMYDWEHYVRQFREANPDGQDRREALYKTFVNLCLGEPYEATGEELKANELQKNIRPYQIGTIPEKLSKKDGNGQIVMLTCAADLNGKEDDARLDYEIVGWTETGSSYSIMHGSIGTFIPREGAKKNKVDREHWTYEHHRTRSVWPEFTKVLERVFKTDTDQRSMRVFITAIDTGHYTKHAYDFIDNTNYWVLGIKGKDIGKATKFGVDLKAFKEARERNKLYLLEVNLIKDRLAALIKLRWDEGNDDSQPDGFMNFPEPSKGLYLYNNYFSHYEAEHRVVETKDGQGISAMWVKKNTVVQNHFFDVRVYNIAIRDIVVHIVCTSPDFKIKNPTWSDFVGILFNSNKKK